MSSTSAGGGAGASSSLEIRQVATTQGLVLVKLAGELDIASAPILRTTLSEACGEDVHEMLVDCAELQFMDSTGLQSLIDARQSSADRGCHLRLRGLRQPIRKLFETTGADRLFDIDP